MLDVAGHLFEEDLHKLQNQFKEIFPVKMTRCGSDSYPVSVLYTGQVHSVLMGLYEAFTHANNSTPLHLEDFSMHRKQYILAALQLIEIFGLGKVVLCNVRNKTRQVPEVDVTLDGPTVLLLSGQAEAAIRNGTAPLCVSICLQEVNHAYIRTLDPYDRVKQFYGSSCVCKLGEVNTNVCIRNDVRVTMPIGPNAGAVSCLVDIALHYIVKDLAPGTPIMWIDRNHQMFFPPFPQGWSEQNRAQRQIYAGYVHIREPLYLNSNMSLIAEHIHISNLTLVYESDSDVDEENL